MFKTTHGPVGAALALVDWACVVVCLCLWASPSAAQVRIIHGPTPIRGGDARSAGDITVVNEKLAFGLAVESPAPYGVPRGALVDLAPVADGKIGRDRVVFADFIPNNWSAWPNTYQNVTVIKDTPGEAVIEADRDWGAARIVTRYSLRSGSDEIHIVVTMTNGGKAPLTGLRSGVTLWPNSGFLFAVPGLAGVEDGPATGALSDRVVAYDADWAIALHAPYLDHVGYGSKDMYQTHSLAPGESRTFEAWLQVGHSGDLAPVVAEEIARRRLPSGVVSGAVNAASGGGVGEPVVVFQKDGQAYAWTLGHGGRYSIALPAGGYTAYATAKGYSQSEPRALHVASGGAVVQDFAGLQPPGGVTFRVTRQDTGAPLDARITIEAGQKPLVEFLGRRTFFTEIDPKGTVDVALAPGDYVFKASYAADVLAAPAEIKASVASGRTQSADAGIDVLYDPRAQGWASADLHHHADQAEAVTPPEFLARSEFAAGLDMLFVSDHDSMVNHRALQAIADRRGAPFMPSVEISTSWAHFNAYPLRLGEPLAIDTSRTDIGAVFAEARRLGAQVVQINHPFIPYGYFASLDAGLAPGGWNPAFDLVEINAANQDDDRKVLAKLAAFWNRGDRYYLTAGTDTHDVWNTLSGRVRVYAHLDGPLTPASFAAALKAGHAYVTYGPLIFPEQMFGDDLKVIPGAPFALGFDLKAVDGLKSVTLVGKYGVAATQDLAVAGREAHVAFKLSVEDSTWYALDVEDQAGHHAYSNPIWVDAALYPAKAP
jgi:hypothetical protein